MSEQTGPEPAGSLFDHYPLGVAWDEMLAEPGAPRTAYKPVFHTLRAMTGRHAQGARRHPRPLLPRPGRHLRLRGGGAALPARRRAAGHLGARVAGHRVRRRAAGHGARVVPRRHLLPRGRDPARRARGHHPVAADRELEALPPRRHGHPPRQRRAGARRRRRPDPRRGGHLPGARGQRAGAVRASATSSPTAARWPTSSPRRSRRCGSARCTTTRGCCSRRCGPRRPTARSDPTVVVLTPGVFNSRLLRARPAGPDDGRRARRGP